MEEDAGRHPQNVQRRQSSVVIIANVDPTPSTTTSNNSRCSTDPIISNKNSPAAYTREEMGRKTAECAAIFCCCPCAAIDILILTVVKLPAGLWRKAMRKRSKKREKRKLRKKMMLMAMERAMNGTDHDVEKGCECDHRDEEEEAEAVMELGMGKSPSEELKAKEEEMWAKFSCTGFWRSPSYALHQRQVSRASRRSSRA